MVLAEGATNGLVHSTIRSMHDAPPQPAGPVPFVRRLREFFGFGASRDGAAEEVGRLPRTHALHPGAASGIEHHELTQPRGESAAVTIACTDFSPDCSQVE